MRLDLWSQASAERRDEALGGRVLYREWARHGGGGRGSEDDTTPELLGNLGHAAGKLLRVVSELEEGIAVALVENGDLTGCLPSCAQSGG